jgi:hypothetical protein
MLTQKINYVLILLLFVGLFYSCKKESNEYTTVIWEVVNPATGVGYSNILVRLYEAKKKSSGIEYSLIYEGQTNNQGRAEYSFKANLNNKYWYSPEINEGSLGVGGIDYAVIKQPSPSVTNVTKDEENIIRYEIVPYGEYVQHTKNIDCQGPGDKMRFRRKFIHTGGLSSSFSDWIPNEELNGYSYIEGCYENLSDNPIKIPSDSILYEIEVIKSGITETLYEKFYVGPEQVDTIKLYY